MGPEIATAYVRVRPNVKGFDTEVAGAAGASGKKAGSKFGGFFRASTLKLLGAVGGIFAGFEFFRGGISRLVGLEEANSRLEAMGLSTRQVNDLSKSLLDTLKGTAFSLDEGAGVMAQMVTTGMGLKDVKDVMKLMVDTAAFAKVPLGEVAGIFQEVASTGKVTGDTLFSLQSRGIPALDLLADAAGVSGEEMKKMVSEGKIDAETFFELWEKGSEGFGENNIKIAGAAKSMGDTTSGAFANLRTAASRLAADLAGPFFEKAQGAFLGTTDAIDNFGKAAVPVVENFAAFLFDTAIPAIGDFASNVSGVLGAAFEVIQPVLQSAIQWIQDFIADLTGSGDKVTEYGDRVSSTWEMLSTATQAAWDVIKAIVTGVVAFIVGFWERSGQTLITSVASIWSGIVTTVQGGIQAISGVLETFAGILTLDWERTWNGLKDIAGGVWTAIQGVVQTGIGAIQGAITIAMGVIQTIWAGIWNAITTVATAVWTAITGATQSGLQTTSGYFQSIFGPVITWWQNTWNTITSVVSSVWNTIFNFVSTGLTNIANAITSSPIWQTWTEQWNGLVAIVQTVWNAILGVVQSIWGAIVSFVQTNLTGLVNIWQSSWNIVSTVAQTVWGVIQSIIQAGLTFISNLVNSYLNTIRTVWQTIWNAIVTILQAVWTNIQNTTQTFLNIVQNLISTYLNAIRTVFTTIWNAINTFYTTTWNTLRNTTTTIFNAISAFMSTTLNAIRTTWNNIWNTISTFLTTTWNAMQTSVTNIFNAISSFISNTITSIYTTWTGIWQNIRTFFTNAWNAMLSSVRTIGGNILTFVRGIPDSIAGAFSGLVSRMRTIGSNILTALGTGISNAVSGVASTIQSAVGSIAGAITGGDGLGRIAGAITSRLAPPGGVGSTSGLGPTISAAWARIRGAYPMAQVTSGFRPGATTLSGASSYHSMGRAIDLVPASMGLFNVVRSLFPNATELIYTPAGRRQLYRGSSHLFSPGVAAQHYDHIHLALKRGGKVPGNAPYEDRIPALLAPGEWVLNRSVAELLGERTLTMMNRGKLSGVLGSLEHGTKGIPGLATGAYFSSRTRLNGPIDIAERTPEFVTPEPQLKRVIAEVMGQTGFGKNPIVNVYIGSKRINELARVEVQRDMLKNRLRARAGG